MPSREIPIRFTPRSVSDALIGDNVQPGACLALQNLIFDPSTAGVLECRPAATEVTDFHEFSITTGVVSAAFELSGIIYGMIGSVTYAGKDEPFAYNVSTDSFLTVTGVASDKLPTTQATSGAWTPPTMDASGIHLVVTHPGFSAISGNFFGWFDITDPLNPIWNAGNTTTNLLPTVPLAVRQFNNRFYFACKDSTVFTDALTLAVSDATNVLTIGDSASIIAMIGVPLSTTSQAILQGLAVFKANSCFQITGDASTFDLGINEVSKSVGTRAARSVVQTPEGIAFMAGDGVRLLTSTGQLTEPDPDLASPFIRALVPSRVSAGYNSDVYRICLQNGGALGSPYQEYWKDLKRGGWTGPHTFRQDIVVPYQGGFIAATNSSPAKLYRSNVQQTGSDSFTELSAALQVDYRTAPMSYVGNIYANASVKTTLEIAFSATGSTYNILARDVSLSALSNATFTAPNSQAIWGAITWGAFIWGAAVSALRPLTIPWTNPLIFNTLVLEVTGPAAADLRLGSFYTAYERLGYLMP